MLITNKKKIEQKHVKEVIVLNMYMYLYLLIPIGIYITLTISITIFIILCSLALTNSLIFQVYLGHGVIHCNSTT